MESRLKDAVKQMFSIHGDSAEHDEIKERIVSGGRVTGTNLVILIMAILIASVGLNMNSTAVIIGAMLISPLMGSIQAIAYGTATYDIELIKKSVIGFVFQLFFSLLASTIYFSITPIKTTTSELLARTQPTIWDVIIAVCGGLAGSIGTTRKEKSNVIPGVAIATALMPPLCTCGYAIANHKIGMLLGAFYLFTVNTFFIYMTAEIVLNILEVPKVGSVSEKTRKKMKHRTIRNSIILIIPSLIVAVFVIRENNQSIPVYESRMENESIIEQIDILFPEVSHVRVGTVEQKNEDNEYEMKHVIIVSTEEKIQADRERQLSDWLAELYGEEFDIIYQSN